jgi:putative endonuclease
MDDKKWYLYILQCKDGSYYTGITDNVVERVIKHNQGKGPDYTRRRRPVALRYWHEYPNKSEARQNEIIIKKWNKIKKQKLVEGSLRLRSG